LRCSLEKFVDAEKLDLQHTQGQRCLDIVRNDPSLIQTIAKSVAEKYENVSAH